MKKRADVEDIAAEWVEIGRLKAWDKNPRNNDPAIPKVKASIERFGFAAPIVARDNGEIIAGHTRYKAALELGMARVPVRFMDLSETDAHALALADNRLNEEADWDESALGSILAEMKAMGEDMALTGFDANEIEKLLSLDMGASGGAPEPEMDRAEELREKWATERGQVWAIMSKVAPFGYHTLLCGDCTVPEEIARFVGDDKYDAMWTDPPYGVAYVGKTKDALTIENDQMQGAELRKFLVDCFTQANAVLAPGAAVYVAHPPGTLSMQFMLAFADVGWRLHQTLIWKKNTFALGHSDYHYSHEPILFGYTPGGGRRGRGGTGWYGDNAQASVFDVDKPSRSELHPTMKPPELVAKMLHNSVPVGGRVYEPFSGSGSTMVAAEQTGRLCSAVELDPKYVAVALERMKAMGCEISLLE